MQSSFVTLKKRNMYTRVNHNIDIAFLFFSTIYLSNTKRGEKTFRKLFLLQFFKTIFVVDLSISTFRALSSSSFSLSLSLSSFSSMRLSAPTRPFQSFQPAEKASRYGLEPRQNKKYAFVHFAGITVLLIYTSCIRCLELSFSSSGSRIDGQKNDAEKTLLERRCKCFNISLMNEGQQVGEMLLLKALF